MSRKRLLKGTSCAMLISMLLVSCGTANAQPASGDWKASTAFGELAFTVNPTGTLVTKLIRDVRNWSCGPVSGSWTTTSSWTDPLKGWPISNSQFAITLSGSMGSLATVWTVNGTFGNTGTEASGTWAFSISGTTCDGSWGPVGPVTSLEGNNALPEQVALGQNYPNPFNPSTIIFYCLPTRSRVALAVFNTLGQQVAILENGEREAGYHDVEFDASGLPSGVYFYRLQAGPYVATHKMLLLR